MAVNKTRDKAKAKEMYGNSVPVWSEQIQLGGLVDISGPVLEENRYNDDEFAASEVRSEMPFLVAKKHCYCPECRDIKTVTEVDDNFAECDDCGYTDVVVHPSSYNVQKETITDTKNPEDVTRRVSFFIPVRRDAYLASKDGRFTRFVDSCSFYKFEYEFGSLQSKFTKTPMKSFVDVNGESRSVQQMTMNGNGDLIAVHHTADKINPNYNNTPFPSRGKGVGVSDLGEIFQPVVATNGEEGWQRRLQMLVSPSGNAGRASESSSKDKAYDMISEKFGLGNGRLLPYETKMSILMMAILYPGVVEREMAIIDENNGFAAQRGEGKLPGDEAKEKVEKLLKVKESISLMDHNLGVDLSRMKTKEEVTAYLRSIIFAETPKVKLPKVMVDVTKSEMLDDGYNGKRLKKMFNTDPYATASNVRTARKMDVRDVNHLNMLLDVTEKPAERSCSHGVLYPIEKKEQLRFVRLMSKGRDMGRIISDIYVPGEDGRDGVQLFEDSASMYAGLMRRGAKIAKTKEEAAMVKYIDFLKLVDGRIDTPEQRKEFIESGFAPEWGPHTADVLAEMSGKIKDYKESGFWNEIYRAPRDGKPLFVNRTLREIHDELIVMQNNAGASAETNCHYEWPIEMHERIEGSYGDYNFHLAKDSNELVSVGRSLKICIGGDNYDRMCRNGHGAIALMTDKAGNYVAAIEADPGFKKLRQFKAYKNGMLYGDMVKPAREWMEKTEVEGCTDTSLFDEHGSRNVNGTNWEVRGAVLRPDAQPGSDLTIKEATMGAELADAISAARLEEKQKESNVLADIDLPY